MNRGKSLAKNSFYNVIYKALNVLFPLVTATYVSRVLMARGVGEVSYAQNIVTYFTILAALGLPNYGTREIAKVQTDTCARNQVFTELFIINAVSTTVCAVVYFVMIAVVASFRDNLNLYIVVGMTIVFNYINFDWFYQGIEEYGYIAKRSFVVKLLMLVLLFVFIRSSNDTIKYAVIYCIGIGGNNLFNLFNLRRYDVAFAANSLAVRRHLRPVLILLASSIAIELYTLVDTTMIGYMCPTENVGYYTNAMKLIKLLISMITAIGGVLLPRLSYYRSHNEIQECSRIVTKVFEILVYLFVPCEIGILLIADLIMPVLFGESFIPGIITLRIASLLICTLGFSNLFGTQVLLTFGAEKKLLLATICGAIVNICLNSCLIPLYAQNGAAVASVISETVVTVMTFFYSNKFIQIHLDKRFITSTIVSTMAMAVAVLVVRRIVTQQYAALLCSMLLGGLIYLLMSILSKNKILSDLIERKCSIIGTL